VAASVVRLDVDAGARALVGAAPEVLFAQQAPILFDEWQIEPALWDLVRREVDDRSPVRGQFILAGSATPNDDVRRHSGAGRISTLRMRPMSLHESGHSSGAVSLAGLFAGDTPAALDPGVSVPQLVERIVAGGWPDLIGAEIADARQWLRDYLRNLVEVDVQGLGARRDPQNVRKLLSALGRSIGTTTSVQALAADVGGTDGPADRDTIDMYLKALTRLMIVEDVPAWGPHMRSATPLRKSATRYLVDPSLGVAALGAGPQHLLADLNATGFHFEGLVVRDLRVYAQPLHGSLSHWRDNNGHEVDIVITLDDGRWAAVEVKMNPDHVDSAADSLLRFLDKVDTSKLGTPAFTAVVTTRSPAYRRPDEVLVVPIAALGP
jgi:predicted AAA+ superfamily ATPase